MKKLITMLSAFSITSSVASLAVACSSEVKGEAINVDNITAEMIINWKTEYKIKKEGNTEVTVKADKLGTLSKGEIKRVITDNLFNMIEAKITALPESTIINLQEGKGEFTDSELKNFAIFNKLIRVLNRSEATSEYVMGLNIQVKDNGTDENDKKFKVTITVKKWDAIKDLIEKSLEKDKTESAALTEDAIRKEIKDQNKDLAEEVVEKLVKNRLQFIKVLQNINLDSIKSMHDLIQIKNEIKTIELDLNSKK